MRVILFITCFVLSLNIFAQDKLMLPRIDTIGLEYRSAGFDLDSIDAANIGNLNLRPAAGFSEMFEYNLAQNLYTSPAGFSYLMNEKRVQPKYIGLPYLGFQYAFGSALNQALNVDYHQFFTPSTHLHFRYHRRTSNGVLRNGGFKLNDVHLEFYHSKKRWSTKLEAYYGGYEYGENTGIETDTLIEGFPIEFTPVIRNNAESTVKKLNLAWDNYYRLLGDSLNGVGLKIQNRFNLRGRVFLEPTFNDSLVENIYIDSVTTRDQYQTSAISNGGGVFFSSKIFQIDATINHKYWRNQNLGQYRDTNEVYLQSLLWTKWKGITIENDFYFNVIGALGEFYNHARLTLKPFQKTRVFGRVNFDNLLPEPYQRFHDANHLQWELSELQTQQLLNVSGGIRYGDTNFVEATVDWTNINNGLYFINNEWRQDTLDFISVGTIGIKGALHLGKFGFYPSIRLGMNTENFSYQPKFSTMNRISFQTKLFEAQRLGIALGVDIGYVTGYQFMQYNTLLSVVQPVQTNEKTPELFRLNAFAALSIDEFRFFVRAEHLDYFINDQTARIDTNYPIMPFIIRIGITWDFFN